LTVGQDASFTAAASGNPQPTAQWMVELSGGTTFSPISGATSDTLDLGAATLAESGNKYEAVFSNGVGSPATTTAATLTVNPAQAAPVVTTNPLSQTLTVGQDASFTAAASGYPTPTVQWMVELSGGSTFSSISGATSDTLDLGAATLAESGNKYEAVFTNGVGSPATTTAATLTVNPVPTTTAHLVFEQQPENVTAGNPFCSPIVVYVENQNGNLLTTNNSTVTISIATGPTGAAPLGGTLSVNAKNGVATFSNLSLTTAGTYTLLASDNGVTSATSIKFSVSAAAACKVVFGQQPSNVTAGSAITPPVTVYVEDKYGNIVTTDSSRVTLSVATGLTGCSNSGSTIVQAKNGVATFSSYQLTEAGKYTLQATDGRLSPAISSGFVVTAGAPAQLVFIQARTCQKHNNPFEIQVAMEDRYGNICTNDNSTITLSLGTHPKNGVLAGVLSAATVNGVATFKGLSVNVAGDYTLLATTNSIPIIEGYLYDFDVA
jgi:S-adenosylmethionine hydrolase